MARIFGDNVRVGIGGTAAKTGRRCSTNRQWLWPRTTIGSVTRACWILLLAAGGMRASGAFGFSQVGALRTFECLRRLFAHFRDAALVALDEARLLAPELARGGVVAFAEHLF